MQLACGSEVCQLPQVCCAKKVPPSAFCIDQDQFIPQGCEILDLPCTVPSQCMGGLICCVALEPPMNGVSCRPEFLCPGDGNGTYRACASANDCPATMPFCEQIASPDADGGVALSICMGLSGR